MRQPCLHSEAYTFTVEQLLAECTITLTQVATGKTKVFFLARANKDNVIDHMNSLTDDLCSQWFNERQPKAKKEKK